MGRLVRTATKPGFVSNRSTKGVWVTLSGSCGESECATGCCACGGKKSRKRIFVEVERATRMHVQDGSQVTVRYHALHETAGALIVFALPLLCSICSLLLWYCLARPMTESWQSICSAAGAFLLGFTIVHLIDRLFRKKFPAEIVDSTPERTVSDE